MLKRILYISYDGMTDALGQSQVIPYLIGLSRVGFRFTILSFEKKNRFLLLETQIRKELMDHQIDWQPLSFTKYPPILAKLFDLVRMRISAINLQKNNLYDAVHCRSYPPSEIGLLLKKKFGLKFVFDMRGFWADEKKDGGRWNISNPFYYLLYRYYKKKETQFLQHADAIVSLTLAGADEIKNWTSFKNSNPIFIIPCCADENLFSTRQEGEKESAKKFLGISQEKPVISYLGSLGTWYMLDEMLCFFRNFKIHYPDSIFLFITSTPSSFIFNKASKHDLDVSDIYVVNSSRSDVPNYVKASDISLSFIMPAYSKKSSSPTKLGELLMMGIPVVVNAGVGDVESIVTKTQGGLVLENFTQSEYDRVIHAFPQLSVINAEKVRSEAIHIYSLNYGIKKYMSLYYYIFKFNGSS